MNRGPWRSGRAARWLPRALGGAVLAAGTAAALSIAPGGSTPFPTQMRVAIVVAAAAVALLLVRRGVELKLSVAVERDRVIFALGRRRQPLALARIEQLRYDPPFAASRTAWLPALAITDEAGVHWRIPALIDDGEELVEALLASCGRDDLAAWADAYGLRRRMGSARRRVAVGYAIALSIFLVAGYFLLR